MVFHINSRIFGSNQNILATFDPDEARRDWFSLSDWYFCPDTGDRIVLVGYSWYNLDEMWRDLNRGPIDAVLLEGYNTIILGLLEGIYYAPDFAIEMHVGEFGLRERRSVRSLIMGRLHAYHVPEGVVERDFARARAGEVVIDIRDDEDDTISTVTTPPTLASEDLEFWIDGTSYDFPIDLTFLD